MHFHTSVSSLLLFGSSIIACGLHPLHGRAVDRDPQFAPIPPSAASIPIGPGGYGVQNFGKGAYMVTDSNYQAFSLVSTKGVIVVDCPPTIGHGMLYAIGNVTSIPITHVIYSHHHADHIGGVFIYGDKVSTIGHVDTAKRLEMTRDANRPIPKVTFRDTYNLHVGNQTLELAYKGEAHVTGNIFIYAPVQNILVLIDIVFPGWTPFALLGQTKNLPGFFHAHDQILEYDFEHYIGGHLGRSGNKTNVLVQKEYALDLKANCEWVMNTSATNDPNIGYTALIGPVSTKNPGNGWAVFKVFLDTLAEACANRTNEKWLGKLAAADVFQFENAGSVIESLRLDYGILGPAATV